MVLGYTVCDVYIPNPGNVLFPGFLQGFIHYLIPVIPYPGNFPYSGKLPYPVISSIRKFTYLL